METWFILHREENLGPYSIQELKLLVREKDLVRKAGSEKWVEAALVPEITDVFKKVNSLKVSPSKSKGGLFFFFKWFGVSLRKRR